MWKTTLVLIFTIIVVPLVAFYYGESPTPIQWHSIRVTTMVYVIAAGLCFIISTLTQNYSQVDKLWSLMPIVYAWIITDISGYENRLVLMAILITVWGARLTYNFWRKGGYSWKFWAGEEDYRWSVLRSKPEFQARWKWVLFNLFFISYYQMGLILLITYPMVKAIDGGPLIWADYLLALLILGWILLETIADQQQWDYQKEKRRLLIEGETLHGKYKKGFIHSGLWSWVRHPNYTAEQALWITFYFFSVVASGQWINWSITGAVLLLLLFKGSSDFSEEISASKYPSYKDYQKQLGRFIPFRK